ncbi:MAG: hypothetical protein ACT4QF_23920 [Sporichthyaceae bacterium]
MQTLEEVFASLTAWEQPPGGANPFRLACRAEGGADSHEIESAAWRGTDHAELRALWSASREAWLFEDVEYGQWGLHVLNPAASASRTAVERAGRPGELRADDVVVGEFLGDSELLVYAPSEAGERRWLIALPLDVRTDWYAAGASVTEVLVRLLRADGEKYWERASA